MMTIKEYINEYHANLNECRKKLKKLNDEFCKSNVKFVKVGDVIEIQFGNKNVRARVTDVKETVKKDEAKDMFEYL